MNNIVTHTQIVAREDMAYIVKGEASFAWVDESYLFLRHVKITGSPECLLTKAESDSMYDRLYQKAYQKSCKNLGGGAA